MTCRRRSIASGTPRTSSRSRSCPTCTSRPTSASASSSATSRLIYPQAVGGDIGCGMLAVAFDVERPRLSTIRASLGESSPRLGRAVPARRRNRRAAIAPPPTWRRCRSVTRASSATRRNEGSARVCDARQRQPFHRAPGGRGRAALADGAQRITRRWVQPFATTIWRARSPSARGCRALDASNEHGAAYLHDAVLGAALRGRQPEGDGRGSGHRGRRDRECAPLLGHRHHDRPQPRVARTPRRARSLGPSQGRHAAPVAASAASCPGRWAAQLSRGRAWTRGGAVLECPRCGTSPESDGGSRQS